jgi:hypothetical protein
MGPDDGHEDERHHDEDDGSGGGVFARVTGTLKRLEDHGVHLVPTSRYRRRRVN